MKIIKDEKYKKEELSLRFRLTPFLDWIIFRVNALLWF